MYVASYISYYVYIYNSCNNCGFSQVCSKVRIMHGDHVHMYMYTSVLKLKILCRIYAQRIYSHIAKFFSGTGHLEYS